MLFVEKSVSRAPPQVLWESKALAPLQHVAASKNPLYRVWYSALWHQFVLALAPEASNLCPRTQGKKAMATAAHPCEEKETQPGLMLISIQEESSQCCMGSISFSCCAWRAKIQLFQTNIAKGMKFCFRNYWARASGFGLPIKGQSTSRNTHYNSSRAVP